MEVGSISPNGGGHVLGLGDVNTFRAGDVVLLGSLDSAGCPGIHMAPYPLHYCP